MVNLHKWVLGRMQAWSWSLFLGDRGSPAQKIFKFHRMQCARMLQEGFSKMNCFTTVLFGFVREKNISCIGAKQNAINFHWLSSSSRKILINNDSGGLCLHAVSVLFLFCALFEGCQFLYIFTPLLLSKLPNWFVSHFSSLFPYLTNSFTLIFLKKSKKVQHDQEFGLVSGTNCNYFSLRLNLMATFRFIEIA